MSPFEESPFAPAAETPTSPVSPFEESPFAPAAETPESPASRFEESPFAPAAETPESPASRFEESPFAPAAEAPEAPVSRFEEPAGLDALPRRSSPDPLPEAEPALADWAAVEPEPELDTVRSASTDPAQLRSGLEADDRAVEAFFEDPPSTETFPAAVDPHPAPPAPVFEDRPLTPPAEEPLAPLQRRSLQTTPLTDLPPAENAPAASGADAPVVTAAGLTRRVPKRPTGTGSRPSPVGGAAIAPTQRSPEEVRRMLSRYRSGLKKGRPEADDDVRPPTSGSRR